MKGSIERLGSFGGPVSCNGCHPLLWRAARLYTSDIKTAKEEEGMLSMLPQRPSPTERHDSRARAKTIYGAIAGKLDPSLKGKVIAIEVDSGEYFTGETILEAAGKARAKHPGKGFHFFRVGFPYVYVWR